MESNAKLKQKWWFLGIIVVAIIIILFCMLSEKTDNSKDVYSNDIKNDISDSENH